MTEFGIALIRADLYSSSLAVLRKRCDFRKIDTLVDLTRRGGGGGGGEGGGMEAGSGGGRHPTVTSADKNAAPHGH